MAKAALATRGEGGLTWEMLTTSRYGNVRPSTALPYEMVTREARAVPIPRKFYSFFFFWAGTFHRSWGLV